MSEKCAKLHQNSKLFIFYFSKNQSSGKKTQLFKKDYHERQTFENNYRTEIFSVVFRFTEQLANFELMKLECKTNDFPSINVI